MPQRASRIPGFGILHLLDQEEQSMYLDAEPVNGLGCHVQMTSTIPEVGGQILDIHEARVDTAR